MALLRQVRLGGLVQVASHPVYQGTKFFLIYMLFIFDKNQKIGAHHTSVGGVALAPSGATHQVKSSRFDTPRDAQPVRTTVLEGQMPQPQANTESPLQQRHTYV
ncbi:hypothetical protein CAPTEDRAFT_197320 [Capitella teleta]|uniref:Uncharacterized protein n=1 Tax=Capitella teleta TaxID=283909 RepID=R7TQ05_CAPTE|nr:hypothetical protein CAPTEDRAFT_197320 [Capitella teleta]|eukprot:ELT95647.1 hypothetical protein CAPTEDRAFT_197320 [Capitella teleta]